MIPMKDGILLQILATPPPPEGNLIPQERSDLTLLQGHQEAVPLLRQLAMSQGEAARSACSHRGDFSTELAHHVPVA